MEENKKISNRNKILIIIACAVLVLALIFGIVAICNKGKNDDGSSTKLVEATDLALRLSSDETYYIVQGIGLEKNTKFIIPDVCKEDNKPIRGIDDNAFENCTKIESVALGKNLVSIGNEAFAGCSNLKSITIGNGVETIGNYAFMHCGSLETVSIGDKVSSIGEGALTCQSEETVGEIIVPGYSSLKNITVSENNTNYKSVDGNLYTKDGSELVQYAIGKTDSTFTIPSSVTKIGIYAFSLCDSLKTITIPDNVETISTYAFAACSNLTTVVIGNGVTDIGSYAFNNCSDLTSVTLGTSVNSIGNNTFVACQTLVEIINKSSLVLEKGLNSYGYIANYALNIKTSGTSDIVVNDDYLFYTYESKNYLISYMGNDKNLTLPKYYNGTSYEIYKYAFNNGKELKSVKIPVGVNAIGDSAFGYCYNLVSVEMADNVSVIKKHAFSNCYALTTVQIGTGVIKIEDYAFDTCKSLATINYNGKKSNWGDITKESLWNRQTAEYIVHCTDGDIAKEVID